MIQYFRKQFAEGTELHTAVTGLLKEELKKLAFELLVQSSAAVDEDISKLRKVASALFTDAVNAVVADRLAKLESRVEVLEKRVNQLES